MFIFPCLRKKIFSYQIVSNVVDNMITQGKIFYSEQFYKFYQYSLKKNTMKVFFIEK